MVTIIKTLRDWGRMAFFDRLHATRRQVRLGTSGYGVKLGLQAQRVGLGAIGLAAQLLDLGQHVIRVERQVADRDASECSGLVQRAIPFREELAFQ